MLPKEGHWPAGLFAGAGIQILLVVERMEAGQQPSIKFLAECFPYSYTALNHKFNYTVCTGFCSRRATVL